MTEIPTGRVSKHFIEQAIDADLASGRFQTVATRFPPEPNGYLHIGHAKSICLNFGLAQKYGGTCNLRFDDTNPAKEETEYVESIMEDVRWLGFEWDNLHYASDYFEQLYHWAEQLIVAGKAYVCDLTGEQTRQYRGTLTEPGRNSPYRDRTPDENLELFQATRDSVREPRPSWHVRQTRNRGAKHSRFGRTASCPAAKSGFQRAGFRPGRVRATPVATGRCIPLRSGRRPTKCPLPTGNRHRFRPNSRVTSAGQAGFSAKCR